MIVRGIVLALEKLATFWEKYTFYRGRGDSRTSSRERGWWHAGGR